MKMGNSSLKSGKMKVPGDAGNGISVCNWDGDEVLGKWIQERRKVRDTRGRRMHPGDSLED